VAWRVALARGLTIGISYITWHKLNKAKLPLARSGLKANAAANARFI